MYNGITDRYFSKDVEDIILNTVLPRMQANRPKVTGSIKYPTLRSKIQSYIDEGYTEYPQKVFDDYDSGVAGLHFQNTGHIAIPEKGEAFAGPHEIRHKIDYRIPLTDYEEDILNEAYNIGFTSILPKRVERLNGYNMYPERVTTNLDARTKLLGRFTNESVDIQNKLIDKKSDEDIFKAIEEANGYGQAYIKLLREHNSLTPEMADRFRKAMKYVGMSATPFGLTLPALDDKNNK